MVQKMHDHGWGELILSFMKDDEWLTCTHLYIFLSKLQIKF